MSPVRVVAGIDEVGIGPLAGPVFAAAVILEDRRPIEGLADSKKLSARSRETLADQIKDKALGWAIGRAEVEEIDRINILRAALLAMQRAVAALTPAPTLALVDGIHPPDLPCPVQTIIKGDASVAVISAASILAKVARDAEMCAFHARFPDYGFASHKGYPTQAHLAALERHGPCSIHRRSFEPVRRLLGPGATVGLAPPPTVLDDD